jgi:hypothetical protein
MPSDALTVYAGRAYFNDSAADVQIKLVNADLLVLGIVPQKRYDIMRPVVNAYRRFCGRFLFRYLRRRRIRQFAEFRDLGVDGFGR